MVNLNTLCRWEGKQFFKIHFKLVTAVDLNPCYFLVNIKKENNDLTNTVFVSNIL